MTERLKALATIGAALGTAISAITACTTSERPASPVTASAEGTYQNWPTLLDDFRFHWSADSSIDLTSAPASVIRAYLESFTIANITFDPHNAYPGFERATPENQSSSARDYLWQLVHVRPLGEGSFMKPDQARPQFGYELWHILELTPSGTGYRAIVCNGDYARFVKSTDRPGTFISIGTDDRTGEPFPKGDSGVGVRRVEITQGDPRVGENAPATPENPQEGPAPAPAQDVFGDWFITGSSGSFWGSADNRTDVSSDYQQRCEAAMPDPPEVRRDMMTGFKDQPPPPGRATPGWPDAVN